MEDDDDSSSEDDYSNTMDESHEMSQTTTWAAEPSQHTGTTKLGRRSTSISSSTRLSEPSQRSRTNHTSRHSSISHLWETSTSHRIFQALYDDDDDNE
jgi:hypothetical protein